MDRYLDVGLASSEAKVHDGGQIGATKSLLSLAKREAKTEKRVIIINKTSKVVHSSCALHYFLLPCFGSVGSAYEVEVVVVVVVVLLLLVGG
jgi:hypothetical protein